jgi:hypothetical protein
MVLDGFIAGEGVFFRVVQDYKKNYINLRTTEAN